MRPTMLRIFWYGVSVQVAPSKFGFFRPAAKEHGEQLEPSMTSYRKAVMRDSENKVSNNEA
jgi:hypothetical protein